MQNILIFFQHLKSKSPPFINFPLSPIDFSSWGALLHLLPLYRKSHYAVYCTAFSSGIWHQNTLICRDTMLASGKSGLSKIDSKQKP